MPHSFHRRLKKEVVTMQEGKKNIKVGDATVCDTELLFTRVLGLQQSIELDIKDL